LVVSCLPTAVSLIYLLHFGYMRVSVSACAILFRWDWQQVANKGSACCHPFADSQGEETEIVHRPLRTPARRQGDWFCNVGAQSGQILPGAC